jgi:hypothetical protein
MAATQSIAPWSRSTWLFGIAGFAIALGVGFELVRPFTAGPVGFDSASSVIHFERITAGRHLESFVTGTPKPFLTVVYGLLYALTGDWRAISWATIGAFAVCVVLGARFAWRIAGPVAGLFAFVALLGSRTLLADVIISYAVPWALVWCLIAGLEATSPRPRPWIVGMALAVAALARLEVLVIVAIGLLAVLVACRPLRRTAPPASLRWWLLGLGLLALPVMLLHDWLLTGDPLFWVSVSQRYSEASPDAVMTPLELLRATVHRYGGMPVLTLLALAGFVVLLRRRAWVPLVAVIAASAGIAAFLELLAIRGTYVSTRYFAAIDLGLIFAAAAGAAGVVDAGRWLLARSGRRGRGETSARAGWAIAAAAAVAAVALALAAIWPVASLSTSFRSVAQTQLAIAENADRVLPAVASELSGIPGAGTFPPPDAPMADDPGDMILLVPPLERPRFAVDLDLPLTQVSSAPLAWLQPGDAFLPYGDVIVHDTLAERVHAYDVLEVDQPATVGAVTLEPVVADAVNGIWVLRIAR